MDDDVDEAWESVGPPTGSLDLEIVDEDGDQVGPGQVGEIRLRGGALTSGYGVPELDSEAFVDGWFRTGDLARQDEAERITLTGRTTLYISTAGFKVDPFEVEQVIAKHPDVGEVVVVDIADLIAKTANHGGDLAVEYRRWNRAVLMNEDLDILARRMEDFQNVPIAHQIVERLQVDAVGQGVDNVRLVRRGDLDEAEL